MLRTYGRVYDAEGNPAWVVITTDTNGFNDYVWATTVVQTLKLNLNESPFFANYGIPAQQSVIQQVPPDYYVAQVQSQFAQYFANLSIARLASNPPTYRVNITTQQGVQFQVDIDGERLN